MEHKWDKLLQLFSAEQRERIFQALGCADENKAFYNVILKSNCGFREFTNEMVSEVSLQSGNVSGGAKKQKTAIAFFIFDFFQML